MAGRQKEHRRANLICGRRVAVTGGAGFIGSHLVEELAPANEVIIIDDLSAGRLENVAPFLKVPGVSFLRGSVTDLPFLQEAFRNIDYVFHQAALTSVPETVAGPLAADEINVRGTLNVLVAARDSKVKKVVYASSCAVYGNSSKRIFPQKEDQLPEPLSPYAASKLAGELYCRIFSETYGLPIVVLRYFNVYGPRQNPDSPYAAVIPVFIKRTLAGLPPVIHGDGNQVRDFIFVKDVVRANLLAAAGGFSGPVNIGTGTATPVKKLAEMIIALAGDGDHLRPVYAPPRPADPRVSRADTKRARGLGFTPRYTLAEGLALTWQSFAAAAGRPTPGKTPGERT
ncbi:MAG: NAD-dependent epimerase/dehydratase family protein [Desulfotomaculales bacterium]